MRSVVSISLLALLLYHTCRVGFVLVYFNQFYPSASPILQNDEWMVVKMPISLPYTVSWQNRGGQDGLIQSEDQFYNITDQLYQNDTLYTVLKTNIAARERFFALAEEIKQTLDKNDSQTNTPKSPFAQFIQLLNQWAKSYLPFSPTSVLTEKSFTLLSIHYSSYTLSPLSILTYPVSTPPPEFI